MPYTICVWGFFVVVGGDLFLKFCCNCSVVFKNVYKTTVRCPPHFALFSHEVVDNGGDVAACVSVWSTFLSCHLGLLPSPRLFFSACFVLSPGGVLVVADGLAVGVRPCGDGDNRQ